ncbi:MAG: PKD domain-containing protein, partial [Myxococcaceae bacterium]
ALTPAVTVLVQDSNGNTVTSSSANITVSLGANPGCSTLSGTLTVAAASGVATFSNLSLNRVGLNYTLLANSGALPQATSASFDISAGTANRLAFTVQPSGAAEGAAIAPAVQVTVQDSSGNTLITSSANVTVTLAANPGSSTLSGTLTLAAVNGVATFSNLSLNVAASGYTLAASSAGLTGATSAAFNISSGGAARLSFSVQPGDTVAGASLAPALQVRVEDTNGNLVTSSSVGITLTLGNNPSGGTLAGTLTVSAVNGVASFSDLSLNLAATGYTLTANTPGLSAATSAPFNIAGAAPDHLRFITPNRVVSAGGCSGVITVQAQDIGDNPATLMATLPLTLSLTGPQLFSDSGCSTPLGASSLTPGLPSVSFYARGTQPGSYKVTASTSGLNDAQQDVIVTAGTAVTLQVSGYPSPVTAGSAGSLTITARDSFGNRADTFVGTLLLASSDGAAVLPTGLALAPGNLGQVTAMVTLNTAGTQSISATSGVLSGAQTGITVVAGPARRFIVSGITSPIPVERWAGITVEARDASGNRAVDFTGTVRFDSTDDFAVLPTPLQLTNTMQGLVTLPQSVRFRTAGTHDVTVSDMANPMTYGAQTGVVVEANSPPAIVRNANTKAAVGVAYRYNGLGRVEADGALPLTFDKCGGPPDFTVDKTTGTVRWTASAPASVAVCVKATNTFGEDQYNFTIDAVNRAPTSVIAVLSADPLEGPAPVNVRLDGSASTAAADALPLMFQWELGDGSPFESTSSLGHLYKLPGGYVVRLTVFDAYGNSTTVDEEIRATGNGTGPGGGLRPPIARIRVDGTPGPTELAASLSCNCQPGDAPIIAYHWQLGTGAPRSGETVRVNFPVGAYNIRLTVVDANGLSATDSTLVTFDSNGVGNGGAAGVGPPRCWAAASPSVGDAPFSTVWTGQATPGAAAIVSQEWTVDNVVVSRDATARSYYDQPGTHAGHYRVTDATGVSCESSLWVTVTSGGVAPPHIVSMAPTGAHCGDEYTYAVAATGAGPMEWSLINPPEGMTIDSATGVAQWIPRGDTAAPPSVTVRAANSVATDEQTFTVEFTCEGRLRLNVSCASSDGLAPSLGMITLALLALRQSRSRSGSRRTDAR